MTAVPKTTPTVKDKFCSPAKFAAELSRSVQYDNGTKNVLRLKDVDSKCSANKCFCSFFYSYAKQTFPFLLSQYGSKVVIPLFAFYYLTD